MTPKRFFFLMIGFIVLAAGLGIGSIVFGQSLLQAKSSELKELKLENAKLEGQQQYLVQAKKEIEKYQELGIEEIVNSVVPKDKDHVRTVQELLQLARESSVGLSRISFPASTLGSGNPDLSQLTPAPGMKGIYQMEIGLGISGAVTYDQMIALLNKLENNRRTGQVTSIGLTPSAGNRRVLQLTLNINAYIKP